MPSCRRVAWFVVVSLLLPAAGYAQMVMAPEGGESMVRIVNPDGSESSFFPYGSSFTGSVRAALSDIDGDGIVDIVTGAGPGGGPHVKVFSGVDLSELASFFAYDPAFGGGVFVAAGDVNGDGRSDIITGADGGGGPHVKVFSGTFNVAVDLQPDAELEIDAGHVERALYVLEGDAQVDGADIPEKHLVVFDRGSRPVLRAKTPVKGVLMGGEPLDAPRHMWWNFVSSSQERIDQAKQDWLDGRFGQVPGETEFIPLPER